MADKTTTSGFTDGGDSQDDQLRAMFVRDSRDLSDDGFSAGVIERIHHRRAVRRWVLGAASLAGLGLAWRPLKEGLLFVSAWSQQAATSLPSVDWTSYPVLAGAGLALLLIPMITRVFED